MVAQNRGQACVLAFKHYQLASELVAYRDLDALQQVITSPDCQAGIKQEPSHSGRRSVAAKVLAAIGYVETVKIILGHAFLDHGKPDLVSTKL
ncbi:integrase [Pseudomonas sp. RP23018S]|uniref:integrase n=1 Tax=Pseudomonas sp. RP23018S TaxID=3096037 RepID=UPI002ACA84D3|nr:integrase [Pseudomonas sp. RP23018S]MDZ5605333.1 integrase [Pseudomonas sp. RP23018S]